MAAKRRAVTYRNYRYRFTLRIPAWWRSFCKVTSSLPRGDAEYELHFLFRYRGKQYGDIFTLLVYPMNREEWLRQGYGESPLVPIAEHGGRMFVYVTPEELPYEFVDRSTGDYDYGKYGKAIKLLKRMVNEEVPRIAQTLRFPEASAAWQPAPYLSAKVKPCGCRQRRRAGSGK